MTTCGERAFLVITRAVEGTSTAIVQQRLPLVCALPDGHGDAHHDPEHQESWQAPIGQVSTLLRHQDANAEE
jgi:hypothetical protein